MLSTGNIQDFMILSFLIDETNLHTLISFEVKDFINPTVLSRQKTL